MNVVAGEGKWVKRERVELTMIPSYSISHASPIYIPKKQEGCLFGFLDNTLFSLLFLANEFSEIVLIAQLQSNIPVNKKERSEGSCVLTFIDA